jgi:hypothetical protein
MSNQSAELRGVEQCTKGEASMEADVHCSL